MTDSLCIDCKHNKNTYCGTQQKGYPNITDDCKHYRKDKNFSAPTNQLVVSEPTSTKPKVKVISNDTVYAKFYQ